MHHIAGHAAIAQAAQRRADAVAIRLVIVVANPGFEQVAEDVERFGRDRPSGNKIDELRAGRRLAGIQMQIGDEQRAQGGSLSAGS
jgi:hypothetical protein